MLPCKYNRTYGNTCNNKKLLYLAAVAKTNPEQINGEKKIDDGSPSPIGLHPIKSFAAII